MNRHDQVAALLAVYPDLGTDERQLVDRHLQACADCAVRLTTYRAMDRRLHRLRRQHLVQARAQLERQAMAAQIFFPAHSGSGSKWLGRLLPKVSPTPFVAGAMLVVGALLLVVVLARGTLPEILEGESIMAVSPFVPNPTVQPLPASDVRSIPSTITHTVQAGETLHSIARKYNVTAQAIVSANEPFDAAAIRVGDPIRIPPGPTPAPWFHITAAAAVAVRSGPSRSYDVLGTLDPHEWVAVTGADEIGAWWRIDFNGQEGWVDADLVTERYADTTTKLLVTRASLVRWGPGNEYQRLGRAETGERYNVIGRDESGGWWQIEYQGVTGWIYAAGVDVAGDPARIPIVPEPPMVGEEEIAERPPHLRTVQPRPGARLARTDHICADFDLTAGGGEEPLPVQAELALNRVDLHIASVHSAALAPSQAPIEQKICWTLPEVHGKQAAHLQYTLEDGRQYIYDWSFILDIPAVDLDPSTLSATETVTYTVRTGDSVFRIAQEHGVSVKALLEENGLSSPDYVFVGQVLRIPIQEDVNRLPSTPPCADARSIITSPAKGEIISGIVPVLGSAQHDRFNYYKLEIAQGTGPGGAFRYFDGTKTPVEEGLLGELDSTTLSDGVHTIQLMVVDEMGNYLPPCQVTVHVQNHAVSAEPSATTVPTAPAPPTSTPLPTEQVTPAPGRQPGEVYP